MIYSSPYLELDPEIDPIAGRIDFNGDGLAEVGVTVGTASFPDAQGNSGMVHGGGLFGAWIAFSDGYPVALQASDWVTESLDFRSDIGTLALSSAGRLGSRGRWFEEPDAYLAARFMFEEQYYYGWVHAVWDAATNTLSVDMAAYEDTGDAAHIVLPPAVPEDYGITFGELSDPSAGQIEIEFPVLGGQTYEVERSIDMENWETLGVITPTEDGTETYLDQFPIGTQSRAFYRIKQMELSPLLLLAFGAIRRRRSQGADS